jgi:hypothetical protein
MVGNMNTSAEVAASKFHLPVIQNFAPIPLSQGPRYPLKQIQ